MKESFASGGVTAASSSGAPRDEMWQALEELWEITRGDPRVSVALVDGPVDQSHVSLRHANLTAIHSPPVTAQANGLATRHGTHVASVLFGQHDGPIRGIAPGCRGLIVPVFGEPYGTGAPACSQAHLAWAIRAAVQAGAHVINISAGEPSRHGQVDPRLAAAVRNAADAGVLVVAAAGDQGCRRPQVPGALPSVIAVGAETVPGGVNAAGNDETCLLAPGEDIPGAFPGGGLGSGSGTSYATAVVSGLAALLLSLQARDDDVVDADAVRRALLGSSNSRSRHAARWLDPRGAVAAVRSGLGGAAAESPPVPEGCAPSRRALDERYGGLAQDRFGTVEVWDPFGRAFTVADLRYPVGGDARGLRCIAVDAQDEAGSAAVDAVLRREMGLRPADHVYALLSYIRPEEHVLGLAQLPYTSKLYLGHRHVAAYVGLGRTTQVLPRKTDWVGDGPLRMRWNVDRHPANVQTVALHGVPQETLNANAHIVDTILTASATSPQHPWEDVRCPMHDLNTTLQYYRDSVRGADYLLDRSWYTNCTVHKVLVVNVLLNVPHNERAFREIFGSDDGGRLWDQLRQRYEEITGTPLTAERETRFTPLWALAGLSAEAIRPPSFADYNRYHAARAEGWLDDYVGPRPLPPGVGLAWPLETLVDLVACFLITYVPFRQVGGLAGAGMLLLLRHGASVRLGIPRERWLAIVTPVVAKLVAADAIDRGSGWLDSAADELHAWVERVDDDASPGGDAMLRAVIGQGVETARSELGEAAASASDGAEWLERTLPAMVQELRTTALADGATGSFFSSPSIFHQLALGLHPKSTFVDVRTVCTVLDSSDLEPNTDPPVPFPAAESRLEDEMDQRPDTPKPDVSHTLLVTPSADGGEPAPAAGLVYALGSLGYDFESQSRRDSIKQKMEADTQPEDPAALLNYLDAHPYDASAVQWTLLLQGVPIYVIEPRGAFANDAYALLRQFLREQQEEGVERVSVPGFLGGTTRHRSGAEIPVVAPAIRGMYSWTTDALVESVVGHEKASIVGNEKASKENRERVLEGVRNFLERVYYEIRNLGRESHERALNFAATNAFEVERVYERAISENLELDTIDVEPSPLCPPGADCWDVKLIFFFPERPNETVRRAYRFTVDVADVVPTTVGPMRDWFIR